MQKSLLTLAAALSIMAGVSAFAPERAQAAAAPADLRAATGSAVEKVWCRRWCGPRGCFRRCGWRRW